MPDTHRSSHEARDAVLTASRIVASTTLWAVAFYTAAVAVLVLATLPVQQAALIGVGGDKGNHVTAFLVLGLLGLRTHPAAQARCLFGLFGFGIAIELIQAGLPYRQAEWQDLVADAVGLCIALGGWLVAHRWSRP